MLTPDSGEESSAYKFALRWGIVITIIMAIPILCDIYYLYSYSVPITNSVDEEHYLLNPYLSAQSKSVIALYAEHQESLGVRSLLFGYPNAWINYVLGLLVSTFSIPVTLLGPLLDLLFIPLTCGSFLYLFYILSRSPSLSLLAFLLLVTVPAVGDLASLFPITLEGFNSHLLGPPMYPAFSVFRGIYTQISYPIVALALALLLRGVNNELKIKLLVMSGILAGLLCYVYFFAWLAVLSVGVLYVVIRGVFECKERGRHLIIWSLLYFLAPALTLSIPGVFLSASSYGASTAEHELFSQYWYFNVTQCAVVLVFLLVALCTKNTLLRELSQFIIAVGISSMTVVNLQPLLGKWMSIHQLVMLYLAPLMSASSMIAWWLLLRPLLSRVFCSFRVPHRIERLAPIFITTSFFIYVISTYSPRDTYYYMTGYVTRGQDPSRSQAMEEILRDQTHWNGISFKELSELREYIEQSTESEAVFAVPHTILNKSIEFVPPYLISTPLPNLINLMTGRSILFQEWFNNYGLLPSEEIVEREIVNQWLLTGHAKMASPCSEEVIDIPGDIFELTGTQVQILRSRTCKEARSALSHFSLCEAIAKYRIDFVVYVNNFRNEEELKKREYLTCVWRSSGAALALYRFHREEARGEMCRW